MNVGLLNQNRREGEKSVLAKKRVSDSPSFSLFATFYAMKLKSSLSQEPSSSNKH
jgi:hypothetical protein